MDFFGLILLSFGSLLALTKDVSGQPTAYQGCIAPGTFDPSQNYFSTAYADEPFELPVTLDTVVDNAYNFTVQYENFYKVVRDTHANTTYLLYLCGAPNPVTTANISNNGALEIPFASFGMNTDVPANFLQLLGVVDALKYITLGPVVDPCLQKVASTLRPTPGPFVVPVIDGIGPPAPVPGQPRVYYGAPNISFSASQDPGALNRAEWIKYVALFFNREELAERVFKNISDMYQCLNGSAPDSEKKPVVGWIDYYEGIWTIQGDVYRLQFVEDAGGVNPPQALNGDFNFNISNPEELASFKEMLKGLDIVMDETYLPQGPTKYSLKNFTTNAQLTPDEISQLPFMQGSVPAIWGVYGTYVEADIPATAWFESAISQPQVVLEDLLSILHPSMFPSGHQQTYLYNIVNGHAKAVTAKDCKLANPAARVAPQAVACTMKNQETTPGSPPVTPASPQPSQAARADASAATVLTAALTALIFLMAF